MASYHIMVPESSSSSTVGTLLRLGDPTDSHDERADSTAMTATYLTWSGQTSLRVSGDHAGIYFYASRNFEIRVNGPTTKCFVIECSDYTGNIRGHRYLNAGDGTQTGTDTPLGGSETAKGQYTEKIDGNLEEEVGGSFDEVVGSGQSYEINSAKFVFEKFVSSNAPGENSESIAMNGDALKIDAGNILISATKAKTFSMFYRKYSDKKTKNETGPDQLLGFQAFEGNTKTTIQILPFINVALGARCKEFKGVKISLYLESPRFRHYLGEVKTQTAGFKFEYYTDNTSKVVTHGDIKVFVLNGGQAEKEAIVNAIKVEADALQKEISNKNLKLFLLNMSAGTTSRNPGG